MNIYTSYFALLRKIDPQLSPVSIARFPPKWFDGYEMKELAPDQKLLWKAKQGKINKEEYAKKYMAQIQKRFEPHVLYEELEEEFNGKDIVLLCFEKKGEFCHRRLLAEWLEVALGIRVKEL
jgi:uncharacterized protein YeaO (DUF488 family)